MSTLAEIEEAITTLPAAEVEQLAEWLERQRSVRPKAGKREAVAAFLKRWTGAAGSADPVHSLVASVGTATTGLSTDEIMRLTRGED